MYLQLPEFNLNHLLPGVLDVDLVQQCSFVLTDKTQAIRHASYLLRILVAAIAPGKQLEKKSSFFEQHLPWLMDSLEALNEEQKRWKDSCAYAPASLLEQVLSLASSIPGVDHVLTHKLDATAVMISADVAEQTNETKNGVQQSSSASKTLALALVHLANASIRKRPIAKLVSSQLLKKLDWLVTGGRVLEDGDLKVSSPMLCH